MFHGAFWNLRRLVQVQILNIFKQISRIYLKQVIIRGIYDQGYHFSRDQSIFNFDIQPFSFRYIHMYYWNLFKNIYLIFIHLLCYIRTFRLNWFYRSSKVDNNVILSNLYVYVHIYIHIYICIYVHLYVYVSNLYVCT